MKHISLICLAGLQIQSSSNAVNPNFIGPLYNGFRSTCLQYPWLAPPPRLLTAPASNAIPDSLGALVNSSSPTARSDSCGCCCGSRCHPWGQQFLQAAAAVRMRSVTMGLSPLSPAPCFVRSVISPSTITPFSRLSVHSASPPPPHTLPPPPPPPLE